VGTGPDGLEAEARYLIDQAEALVADAQQHRARVMAAARAEAARIIQTAPTAGNGRL
jgi:F0F1-type ATP synthase membrane subunit b/b'